MCLPARKVSLFHSNEKVDLEKGKGKSIMPNFMKLICYFSSYYLAYPKHEKMKPSQPVKPIE